MLDNFKEYEKKAEEYKKAKLKANNESLIKAYKELCNLSKVKTNEQGFLDFAQAINEIAHKFPTPIQARSE
jgi:hypothetical protein